MTDAKPWSQYWASGKTESLHGGGGAQVLAERWGAFFESVPEGAKMLDLACGAGAVSKLAVASARGFDITGVDYASGLPMIFGAELKGGISIEDLPFDDSGFDCVISQYGFEYADTVKATREAARMLSPGGAIALLIHAKEGQPIADAGRRLKRAQSLLADGAIVPVTEALIRVHANGGAVDALQNQAASAWQNAASGEQDETTHWAIGFCGDLWRRRAEFEAGFMVQNIEACKAELIGYTARLQAMLDAAMGETEMHALMAAFEGHGLSMQAPASVEPNGSQTGWWLQGAKR